MSATRPARPRIFGAPPPIMIGGPDGLHRLRQSGETADVDERTVHVELGTGPVGAHDVDVLGELGDAHGRALHRHAETVVLVGDPTGTEPDDQAPFGQHVERRHLLRQHDRVVEVAANTRQPTRNVVVRAAAMAIDVSGAMSTGR